MLLWLIPLQAQQMDVHEFIRLKKGLFNYRHVAIDKKQAILDLKTGEKGFTFLANGTTEIQAEEGEGILTLKVPHKTTFIVIKHPEYGQLAWKVPVKNLKKKNHYEAFLYTNSPDKEYKVDKQWVIFKIKPVNAIVGIDSTQTSVRTGNVQFYLPVGKHTYWVESPFYSKVEDTFELSDSVGLTIPVELQPFYSYLTVNTAIEGSQIFVDGLPIGMTQGTSGHLNEGTHRVTVIKNEHCYYDEDVVVGKAEKKTLDLTLDQLYLQSWKKKKKVEVQPVIQKDTVPANHDIAAKPPVSAPVTIKALDENTEIFVNHESVGYGQWEGQLEQGFYTVSSKKDDVESLQQYIWIEDEFPQTLVLNAPVADYGVLNIHSNEIGAEIYMNKNLIGHTPCVVNNLPAGKRFKIRLRKKGFQDVTQEVSVIGNDMVDVELLMKRK